MRKIVIVFGLISGAILSVGMLVTIPFIDKIGDHGELVGYTTMVLAFLLVFFGIRSYRDNAGGTITFGRAFAVGSLISLIASLCYVATWEVLYFGTNTMHAFAGKMPPWYNNPLLNAAVTLLEPLPVGLIMTLVSAGILRRRNAAARTFV